MRWALTSSPSCSPALTAASPTAVKGRVEIIAAVLMLIGASIGAQIGVTAVKYIRGYGIRLLFAIMIILAGTSVALKQFKFTTAAAMDGHVRRPGHVPGDHDQAVERL